MRLEARSVLIGAMAGALICSAALALYVAGRPGETGQRAASGGSGIRAVQAADALELSPHEFAKFKVEPAQEHEFRIQREAVGSIDFNQEMSVQVFAPFAGRILSLYAKAGDDVRKGATLFTLDSPDLLEAESKLISAAGTLNVANRSLERARQLFVVQGASQKDLEQAAADQQAAEGALEAARDALRIFGKTDADLDRIVAQRRVDSVLVVRSPIAGRVTARNAAPGLFAQPGSAPAPYTVSDISTMWMIASVPETDFRYLAGGQELDVTVAAYPGRIFRGRIVRIGATVDPSTRRVDVRSEVRDPRHELRPGMFATFLIRTGQSIRSLAVPYAGVVREGDGTMTVWVNADDRHLARRTVQTGLQQDGLTQILAGLEPGERVATTDALFLNNALTAASR
jgi:membrane fusion protein, heavy metal efflux system